MTNSFSVKKNNAFTLLELMAVMAIMITLSILVVTGFGNTAKAIGSNAGVNSVRKMLNSCRQQAMLDCKPVYLFITGPNTFVAVRQVGEVSNRSNGSLAPPYLPYSGVGPSPKLAYWIYDEFSDLSSLEENFSKMSDDEMRALFPLTREIVYNGLELVDLSIKSFVQMTYPPWYNDNMIPPMWTFGIGTKYVSRYREYEIPDNAMEQGNKYGMAIGPEQELPMGFLFDKAFVDSEQFQYYKYVLFNTDGTVESDLGKRLTLYEVGKNGLISGSQNIIDIELSSDGKFTATDR